LWPICFVDHCPATHPCHPCPFPEQRSAVACGQLPVPLAAANLTLSIVGGSSTAECTQLAALAMGSGGVAEQSCARCPALLPSTAYSVFLAPSSSTISTTTSDRGEVGSMSIIELVTGTNWVSSIPFVRGAATGNDTNSIASARVAAAGESAFNLTFSLSRPGTLHFVVLYASMMARYVDTWVAFDNSATDALSFMSSELTGFSGGIVARGSCAVEQAGALTSCRLGPAHDADTPGSYSCSPSASCQIQNACFGSLCDYSRYSIVANSTYKVSKTEQGQSQ